MNHEATVELLSRFLDGEVAPQERERIEEWLENDREVREIYEGLSRVRGSLAHLAEASPPAHLGALVQRRIALEAEASNVWSRVDRRLRSWSVGPGVLTPFAVILALAAMFYVLSNGLARFERAREPVFVTVPESRVVAGLRLARRDVGWVEVGLDAQRVATARRVEIGAAGLAEWKRRHADLAPLAELGTVVLELDGEVVRIAFASGER